MSLTTVPQTLFRKRWRRRLVEQTPLIPVVRRRVCEATSPQGSAGLRTTGLRTTGPRTTGPRTTGRQPWRRATVIVKVDHIGPTPPAERKSTDAIADPLSRMQVRQLDTNCTEFGINQFGITGRQPGIIHVIGSERGATRRGLMMVVTGDSRTRTHGALGALGAFAAFAVLAFGVGTRVGPVGVDDRTIDKLRGRPRAPGGASPHGKPARAHWDAAVACWRQLANDADAHFDHTLTLDAAVPMPGDNRLAEQVATRLGMRMVIDLPAQTLTPEGNPPVGPIAFDIDAERERRLLNSLAPSGLTLEKRGAVRACEARRREQAPWLFGSLDPYQAPAPEWADDTIAVLGDIGFSSSDIAALRGRKVVA